jgi:acetate---CoA ligase (ADP-forming)
MDLKKLIEPESIAVVGVSFTNPFNPANIIYSKNQHHYKARTYGVNPNGGQIYGQKIYKSITEIPDKIDMAVLAVKAELVPATLRECIAKGVAGAVIISGGFAEAGRKDLQDEIIKISQEHDFPMIGPNCIGVYSPPHTDTSFAQNERLIYTKRGNVSLISQSGGILVDLAINLTQEGVGLSRAISIGNKAVVDEVELLKYFKNDHRTKVIGMYMEGFTADRGRLFVEEVNKLNKPVVLFKSGKTPSGLKAVSSHTASIAGDYMVFSEVLKGSKAMEVGTISEFVSFCEAYSCYPKTATKNNVCIISVSGGHGAMAADSCYTAGLNNVAIPQEDKDKLRSLLSKSIQSIASLENPLDLTGSTGDDDIFVTTKFLIEKDYVDCIVLLLLPYVPHLTSDIGARIAQLVMEYKKPIITYMPHVDKYGIFIDGFETNGIPVAHSVPGAMTMAKALARRKL